MRMLFERLKIAFGWMLAGLPLAVAAAGPTNEVEQLHGTVTFRDAARQLLVLQQDDQVVVLQGEVSDDLKPGERVTLAAQVSALVTVCPGFPDAPHGRQIRENFEAPLDWSDHFLSRLHGVIHPPVTGNYTFWVASDDSSELRLSPDENPAEARRIAQVPSGRWTESRQWTRISSQRSAPIRLEAGKGYYLEALGQDSTSRDCLAVAWQGPGFTRELLEGKYVTPGAAGAADRGVVWEYWTNFFATDFSQLRNVDRTVRRMAGARLLQREPGELPEPVVVREGQLSEDKTSYRWVRLDGRVQFVSGAAEGWTIELMCGQVPVRVRFRSGTLAGATLPVNSMVRLVGFYEPALSLDSGAAAGVLWVDGPQALEWLDTPENWTLLPELPQYRLTAANPELASGQMVRTQGRVTAQLENGLWRLEGKDTIRGFVSEDGTNWVSLGAPMELGLSNQVFVGVAVASHRPKEFSVATFDQIVGLGRSLVGADIGPTNTPGGFEAGEGSLRVRGSGDDIWGNADQCFFVHQLKPGDFEIHARLTELQTAADGAKVVLMVRESLAGNSPWAGLAVMPPYRLGLQGRLKPGQSASGALTSQDRKYGWLKLVRQRNSFLVSAQAGLRSGEAVELLGRIAWRNEGLVIESPRMRALASWSDAVATVTASDHPPVDFRQVQISELRDEAMLAQRQARLVNVRIRGVVTYSDLVNNEWCIYVQDQSGSVRVQGRQRLSGTHLPIGEWVELTGAPVITETGVELLAHGFTPLGAGELPLPIRYPADTATAPLAEGSWSEWEGVGRAMLAPNRLLLMTRAGNAEVYTGSLATSLLTNWVNARVRVRGVMLQRPNPLLLLPGERYLQIVDPPPDDSFSAPALPIAAVRNLELDMALARRIKVAGIVTCRRGDRMVVQDQSGGVTVKIDSSAPVKVGEGIELVGFPGERPGGIELSGALWRSNAGQVSVHPIPLGLDDFVPAENNNRLVSVEATLLAFHLGNELQTLDVQSGPRAFQVSLPVAQGQLPPIAAGSRLRLTGVVLADVMATAQATVAEDRGLMGSVELWLRDPADVVVIERPPWWNWKYTVASGGVAVAILVGAVIWIRTLRQRVDQRTHELRETMSKLQRETQISATLAERDRLAGEIHDSIEQGLSAIMLQMDAAAHSVGKPEVVRHYLMMARNMANFSRTEVQHAVWDMQSPLLENSDLPTALRRMAADISAGDSPRVSVEITGAVQTLPSPVEHHLLRIAQEAMTNAVKHGSPTQIWLALEYAPGQVKLTVRDDGTGFKPEAVSDDGGHFGLHGMRNRAQKLAARLSLTSKPGAGTCIEVIVPVDHRAPPPAQNDEIS